MQDQLSPNAKDPGAHNGESNAMPAIEGSAGTRVFIETYGCQMNLADSELMGGILKKQGFSYAPSLEEADVILVNTCAVREKAEERVFGRLTQLLHYKTTNPDVVLGVTGCMAEHLKDSIVERAPYVDLVVGPDAYRRLPELLRTQLQDETDPLIDVRLDKGETYDGISPVRGTGTNGWVTVQRGCDKFCTFCIVPFTRGRERGVPPTEILRQAQELGQQGYTEITLLGQTVNSYRWEDWDFADLLEQLVKVDGIERVRFTSPYPIDFTDKLIATMATHDKICKYLHLPVQSGSQVMLERMRRGYTRADYDTLVTKIRAAMPQVAISTDIIVGFSGETEEDFEMTMELVRQVRYDFSYLFKYSKRSGTYAARNMPDDIPEVIKSERLSRIIALQEDLSAEIFASKIGTIQTLLVEGPSRRDPNEWCGRTDDFKMTVFPKPAALELRPGQLVRVCIDGNTSHTLRSVLV
jgi:tRNA-2-methylthio-N6-dimethylallyladenosine synthase